LVCLFVFDGNDAVGVYNNVVEAQMMKRVDNVTEFVVEKGWLVAINGGRSSGGINGEGWNHPPLKRQRLGA
jgi:hypothetical protein